MHWVNVEGEITLSNYWEVHVTAQVDRGRFDDRETRGYGLYRRPGTQKLEFHIETDSRQPIVAELNGTIASDQRKGRFFNLGAEVEVKPMSNLTLQFEIDRGVRSNEFAWVANTEDAFEAVPRTYTVFADRTTEEWDFTTRGSFVFTRDLTLQVYLQLFFAKGKYENGHKMLSPDTFVPYKTYSRPDFNELSFNSNVVLRWEYLPGSTMYLVWSQARRGERGDYQTGFSDNFTNTFSLPVDNVLMLKVSYWLSM
jgi:hypothetical protein